MIPYIAFYSCLVFLSFFTFLGDKNLKIAAVLFAVLLSVLFAGLRDGVGVDDSGYELYFENVGTLEEVVFGDESYLSTPRPYEPAFYYLMVVSKQVSQDFSTFKIFSSLIIMACVLRAYSLLTVNYSFPVFVFFSLLFIDIVFHQFRNGLAMGFFALALAHAANKRVFLFSIYSMVSIAFHLSAIVILIVPFLKFFSFGFVNVILILGVSYAFREIDLFTRFVEFFIPGQTQGGGLLETKVLGKLNSQEYQGRKIEFGLGFIKSILLIAGLFFKFKRFGLSDLEQFIAKFYLIGLALFIALSNYGIFASRVFRYFGLLEPILVLSILLTVKEKSTIMFVFFAYFLVNLFANSGKMLNFPYRSVL